MEKLKIIWTKQAKQSLQNIYNFYKEKSLQGAKNVKSDILESSKSMYFAKQYQLDDINPNYRRIIVRGYKLLYKEEKGLIQIIDIFATKQAPAKLKRK